MAVIGGSGFLGRHVGAALAAAGHEPLVVARGVAGTTARRADVTDGDSLDGALAGCAAAVSVVGGLRQATQQTFHDVHVRGMRHLVDACREQRVRRVVHVSALGAAPASPSAFLRAKFLGEDLLRRSLLDVTVLRPSAVFGAGDDFVTPLARMLRAYPVAPLPGRGRARLEPIAARDVAAAAVAALARPESVGQAYELPGPERLTIGAIYDRVLAAIGRRTPRVGVPYWLIEPLALLLGTDAVPFTPFTLDQLAILEESRGGDGARAARELGLPGSALQRLDPDAIRALLAGA